MPHNVSVTNAGGNANIQSACRPIFVEYTHSGGTASVMLLAQVEVYRGTDVISAGSPLVITRSPSSLSTSPVYTFDVSSILKGYIDSADHIDGSDSIFLKASNTQTSLFGLMSTNLVYNNLIKYRVSVRAYFLNSDGILTLNEDDAPVVTADKYACDIYIKDEFLSETKFANLPTDLKSLQITGSNASVVAGSRFMTNCPSSLVRKIEIGSPFTVSRFHKNYTGGSIDTEVSHTNDSGVNDSLSIPSGVNNLSKTIVAFNFTPKDGSGGWFNEVAGTTASGVGKHYEIFMKSTSNFSEKLKFELYNNSTSGNPNLDKLHKDFCAIYFINDYNVLDYYLFDGFLDITHNHTKSLFKTGFKDYTSRTSSKRGIASASTEEVYNTYSLVNKETAEWLSEIYRSKKVYYYDRINAKFIPVIVVDGEITTSYANKIELQPITLSFVKDIHAIKY